MSPDPASPVGDDELPELLAPITSEQAVVLAVSGGADSTALLWLTTRLRALRAAPFPMVLVATVDHGLRPESASEALAVAALATRLGFPHRTLVWSGPKPTSGLAEAAREARYHLLAECALDMGCALRPVIVTAHHADDLFETFLMRLARGTGLDGLVGMQVGTNPPGMPVSVRRPLLGVPGSRLVATLAAAGLSWIEDPSNTSDAFERARLRKALPVLTSLGIDRPSVARTLDRLARAQQALETVADRAETELLGPCDGTWLEADLPGLLAHPDEIAVRILQRVIRRLGGRGQTPPLAAVERLLGRLHEGGATGDWRGETLAGCRIEPARSGARLHVIRELGRTGLAPLTVTPGDPPVVWDARLVIAVAASLGPTAVVVRALETDGLAAVARSIADATRPSPPRPALLASPSVWRNGDLVAAPGLAALLPSGHPLVDAAGAVRIWPLWLEAPR